LKRVFAVLTIAVCLAAAVSLLAASPGTELGPPTTGGLTALDPLLQKLTNNRRLLIVGAHPDDENTALLALVSRRMGGEAAYLSLSRGEGGQNLIGEELGVGLGLIRSQELMSARRLDGARQYFTRAYDFGYTRSLDETLRLWPREVLLEDATRVVRRFCPQVIFSTFTGTDRDGHGQHQASALVAREVFRASGDAAAFPQLAREGLSAWSPTTLIRSNWFDRDAGFRLSTGEVEPLTGRSYQQIAMASRSLHRSQDMGRLQPAGPSETGAIWVEGGQGTETKDLFAGVDTRLRSIAAEMEDASRRARVEALLDRVEAKAIETRRQLSPAALGNAVTPIASMLQDLRAARELTEERDSGPRMLLEEKIGAAETALAAAAGIALDAISENETASAGEAFAVTVQIWNPGSEPVDVESVSIASPDAWTVPPAAPGRPVPAGKLEEWKLQASVPADAAPTLPYFLHKPLKAALYDWSDVAPSVRGEPFQPPPLTALVRLRIAGSTIQLSREVTYRFRVESVGEVRHPLRAVPGLEVAVDPTLVVWPQSRYQPMTLEITLTSNAASPVAGNVEVLPPPGWPVPKPSPFSLARKGDRALVAMPLSPGGRPGRGRFEMAVRAVASDGRFFTSSIGLIDYEHIRPTPDPRSSTIAASVLDLRLPELRSVGYVRGPSDRVPDSLSAVGIPIVVLTAPDLDHGDLSRFDAIVVGSRAYETNPALSGSNGRLLDYARGGGLVVVQYQQYAFVEGGFAPAKLEIAQPHDRVTDEASTVTVLDAKHPIFTTPNLIGADDWNGWVQERGLYFAHSWDGTYAPLLEMADPAGPAQRGGLLVANVGRGHYVYTGLAFFRQLPAGVPGAYRLFANLLAWRNVQAAGSGTR
jgi:LmbE family N-acetylglucosaminyl deacetylase